MSKKQGAGILIWKAQSSDFSFSKKVILRLKNKGLRGSQTLGFHHSILLSAAESGFQIREYTFQCVTLQYWNYGKHSYEHTINYSSNVSDFFGVCSFLCFKAMWNCSTERFIAISKVTHIPNYFNDNLILANINTRMFS